MGGRLSDQAMEVMEDLNVCCVATAFGFRYHFVAAVGRFIESVELLDWNGDEIICQN